MDTARDRFRGTHALLITPFDDNGEIDPVSLREHIDFVIEGGVAGVVGLGTTGEFFTLSLVEKLRLMTLIAKYTAGRVTLTFGVGDTSTRACAQLAHHAELCGADATMLLPPYYYPHTADSRNLHFRMIAATITIPIMLYDGAGGIQLPVQDVKEISRRSPSVTYIKMANPEPLKIGRIVREVPEVSPLCGDENMLVLGLRHGAIGSTVGISNVVPAAVSRIHVAFDAGDLELARSIQMRDVVPLNSVCNIEKAGYIRCFKEILAAKGIIASPETRPPLTTLDALRKEEVLATAKELGVL
jgi:4-hydroxy-tetrahydrodipicolinate synthase